MKKIYMYVDTSDEYLLPLAIHESPTVLAEIAGVTKCNVISSAKHGAEKRAAGKNVAYKFEQITLEDEE